MKEEKYIILYIPSGAENESREVKTYHGWGRSTAEAKKLFFSYNVGATILEVYKRIEDLR